MQSYVDCSSYPFSFCHYNDSMYYGRKSKSYVSSCDIIYSSPNYFLFLKRTCHPGHFLLKGTQREKGVGGDIRFHNHVSLIG